MRAAFTHSLKAQVSTLVLNQCALIDLESHGIHRVDGVESHHVDQAKCVVRMNHVTRWRTHRNVVNFWLVHTSPDLVLKYLLSGSLSQRFM